MNKFRTTAMAMAIILLWSCAIKDPTVPGLGIEHVVLIGFDGLSPDGIGNARTPNFDRLMREGAYTFHARAVLPTSSSPNWASMIMGAGTEQHGITSNAWDRDDFILPAIVQSDDFLFPTIFQLIDKQIKDAEIGAIYHWDGFGRLFEKSAVDHDIDTDTEEETAMEAVRYLEERKPTFTFIHFDHVDHAGHEYGHGTQEYYNAVEKADTLLGQLMAAITKANMAEETLVVVSADHGGVGKGHGGESLKEIEIPFMLWGKSVKKNHRISYPVYQYDNAATVAYALGMDTPIAWIGKPVKTAFIGHETNDRYKMLERLKSPLIYPLANGYRKAGGLFDQMATIRIENPNGMGLVRYTLDGRMPTQRSKAYENPLSINENSVIKSALFIDDNISSDIEEAFIRIKTQDTREPVSYAVYYLENLSALPDFESLKPEESGRCFEITSDEISPYIKESTAVRFNTTIMAKRDGYHTFYIRSDDGSKLLINNVLLIENDGDHGVIEKSGKIFLKKGLSELEVQWFNGGGSGWLDVFHETEDQPKQILSTTRLMGNGTKT